METTVCAKQRNGPSHKRVGSKSKEKAYVHISRPIVMPAVFLLSGIEWSLKS